MTLQRVPLIVSSSNRNFYYRAFYSTNFRILRRMNSIHGLLFARAGGMGGTKGGQMFAFFWGSSLPNVSAAEATLVRSLALARSLARRKVDGNFISIIVALAPRSLHTRTRERVRGREENRGCKKITGELRGRVGWLTGERRSRDRGVRLRGAARRFVLAC